MKKRFSKQWLDILCSLVPGIQSALIMMPDNQGQHIRTLAEWPNNIDNYEEYTSIVEYALEKKTRFVFLTHQVLINPVPTNKPLTFLPYLYN